MELLFLELDWVEAAAGRFVPELCLEEAVESAESWDLMDWSPRLVVERMLCDEDVRDDRVE